MTESTKPPEGSVLRRWSRLKTEARDQQKARAAAAHSDPSALPGRVDAVANPVTARDAAPASDTATNEARGVSAQALPPVESLTIDSDFSPFLEPKVDEALKRRALKQLFRDPHFNVMDGLDIYIGDYTQPDPIPPEIVREMVQGRYIFNPPPTRVNAQGYVEDVPPEELAAADQDAQTLTPNTTVEPAAVDISQFPAREVDTLVPTQPDTLMPMQLSLLEGEAPFASPSTRSGVAAVARTEVAELRSATTPDPQDKDAAGR